MGIEQPEESDLRRRAAWLLGMLVLVAALLVVLMLTLLKGSSGSRNGAAPDDPYATTPAHAASTSTSVSAAPTPSRRRGSSVPGTGPTTRSCPTSSTCVLQGDPGAAGAAINSYRRRHGQSVVDATVSPGAQACARSEGNANCSGGWAVGQTTTLDGGQAVQQVARIPRNGLLDAGVRSFEIGWAYDPGAHQYFIAIIHND